MRRQIEQNANIILNTLSIKKRKSGTRITQTSRFKNKIHQKINNLATHKDKKVFIQIVSR